MDFIPQPEDTKKFGSMRWLKWHLYKYPTVFIIFSPVPFIVIKMAEVLIRHNRQLHDGTYAPNVIMNRYAICRPGEWSAENTPKRYQN